MSQHWTYEVSDVIAAIDNAVLALDGNGDARPRWMRHLLLAWRAVAHRVYHGNYTFSDKAAILQFEIEETQNKINANESEREKLERQMEEIIRRKIDFFKAENPQA